MLSQQQMSELSFKALKLHWAFNLMGSFQAVMDVQVESQMAHAFSQLQEEVKGEGAIHAQDEIVMDYESAQPFKYRKTVQKAERMVGSQDTLSRRVLDLFRTNHVSKSQL
jgi:hypothetical protein